MKFIPTGKNRKTLKVARLFIKHLYRLYGVPIDIVSNRDRKFDSRFWRAVFKKLDTTLSMSLVGFLQFDAQKKRVNQVLEDMLQAYVTNKQSN